MDIMAGHTITSLYRAMTEIAACNLVSKFIVAGKTELLGAFLQHGFHI